MQFISNEGMSDDAPYVSVNLRPSHRELRPMLFTTDCVGFLTSHRTVYHYCKGCETGPTVYRLYPRIKTRMSNSLRCHFKAALSPRTRPGFNQRPSVQH